MKATSTRSPRRVLLHLTPQLRMDPDTHGCTKVAVIGSGLAGLTAAHLLSVIPSHVQVHVFEKSEELGMDNSSISIKSDKGSYRIDVPMRSINSGSHGRVKKLYDYLRVPLVKNEFSYSFSRLAARSHSRRAPETATGTDTRSSTPLPPYSKGPTSSLRHRVNPSPSSPSPSPSPPPPPFPAPTATLIYEGSSGLRWPPVAIPSHLSTDSSSLPALVRSSWRRSAYIVHLVFLAVAYLHLLVLSFFYVKSGLTRARPSLTLPVVGKIANVAKEPLEDWCRNHRVLEAMREEVLVPLMAAVCTVGIDEARKMPVGEALEYVTSTFISAHYTTAPAFGVRGIVRRLIAPVQVSNIYLSSHIHAIVYNPSSEQRAYTLRYRLGSGSEGTRDREDSASTTLEELDVDYIIFATQANQAASLLETLSTTTTATITSTSASSSSSSSRGSRRRGRRLSVLSETISALKAFRYVSALVVNHVDRSFLPPNASDRRDLNLAAFPSRRRSRRRKASPRDKNEDKDEDDDDDDYDCDEEGGGVWTTHLPSTSVETTHVVSSHPTLVSSSSSSSTPLSASSNKTTTNLVVVQQHEGRRKIETKKNQEKKNGVEEQGEEEGGAGLGLGLGGSGYVLQTTNPLRPVRPELVLSSSWFSRAFVTVESKDVLPRFLLGPRRKKKGRAGSESATTGRGGEGLQGHFLGADSGVGRGGGGGGQEEVEEEEGRRTGTGGVYFTGSWCERGIPLLEGCVTSAENVVREVLEREGITIRPHDWPF